GDLRMRQNQRGMSMWPFVISLVLLLIFVFLWFGEKSDAEKATNDKIKAEAERQALNDDLGKYEEYVREVADTVGYASDETIGAAKTPATNLKKLRDDLNADGTGAAKKWKDTLQVKAKKNSFSVKAGGATEMKDTS